MSVTLSRSSGASATYTNQELAALITSLEASNNQHVVASGVAFYRISALRMLILDVDALHNRKLVETYAITHDSTNPFELKFTSFVTSSGPVAGCEPPNAATAEACVC